MLEPGEPLPEDLPQQEHDLDSASSNNVPIFDWKCVDVVGSPGLTRLIGALTIEECQEISFLDLNGSCSNSGQSLSCDPIDLYKPSNISKLRDGSEREPTLDLVRHLLTRNERCMPVSWESNESKDSNRLTDISAGSILRVEFGISPFPQHTPRKRHAPSLSCGSPVLPESECMKLLRGKTPTEIPNLMKSLWCIARKSYSAGQFSAAESWYRRIVTANQQNLEVQPCETFEACLWVIRSMTQQGKCSEALELHEGLHAKILSLFNSAHPLCFLSRATRAVTLINVGKSNESQEIRREIVQIYLTTFGTRHPQTLKALRALGFALALMNRYLESEQLLRTALHIQLQEAKNSEGDIEKKEEIYKTMTRLAYILNQVGRYKENRGLLSSTESLVGHKISPENPRDFYHCYEMARAWRLEGRLHDSENMLQELLESQGSTMGRNRRLRTMASLAEVLTLSGRLQEAARWYKEIYLLDINISGIAHKYTLQSCKDLGFCYAQQAQYGQAMLLFEETIENINLNTSEDLELRSSSIDTVQLWIHRIQRMEARNLCDSEEDAGREPSMRW
jgi:tetratricopeptide (TPR) repeat protein